MSEQQYPVCPWCGIGPSIRFGTGTIDWDLESDRGNWQCGSCKHGVEPYQSPACRRDCCESRVEELETEVERLRAEHERLRAVVRVLRAASIQSHSGHFDKTGQHGGGCPECIRARKLRDEADEILRTIEAATGGGEE